MKNPGTLKVSIIVLFIIMLLPVLDAQRPALLRSTINSGGSSRTISLQYQHYLVQQSIGQSSPIGIISSKGVKLRQGFIQPLGRHNGASITVNSPIKVYPNPFQLGIICELPDTLTGDCMFSLHDLFGKTIWTEKQNVSGVVPLHFPDLQSGLYLLRVRTSSANFQTCLIKE